MKRSACFFTLVFLTIAMNFSVRASDAYYAPPSVPDKPIVAPQTPNSNNKTLDPTSGKTYESNGYGFKIQLNDSWEKPSSDAIKNFGYPYNPRSITFYNNLYDTVLFVNLQALPSNSGQINLNVLSESIRRQLLDLPEASDVSVMENTTLSKVPFKYATLKLTENGQTATCYYYMGCKGNLLYTFIAFNVTETNQTEVFNALLGVSIR